MIKMDSRSSFSGRLQFKHLILIALFVFAALMISLFYAGYNPKPSPINPKYAYKTWQLVKLYVNGKQVKDNKKYANLKLRVNKDGTADWIRPDNKLNIDFKLSIDGTQIVLDNGYTLEDIETVFELTENRFRFGKRNIASRYEYVMEPSKDATP